MGLPLLALMIIGWIALAPDDYRGRVLVIFQTPTTDTQAYIRLANAGMRPLRVISSIGGWIAEAEQRGGVAGLSAQDDVLVVFRDIGLGRAMAGCLGLALGPARPRGPIP